MELREVRSFIVLAEQLHFGRASRLLSLSQPALTKQIRGLEEEIGGRLLDRNRNGTKLTALGQLFQEEAKGLIQQSDDLLSLARRAVKGEAGRIRIGFGLHTFDLVPRLLVQLRALYPAVKISVRDMSTAEQTEALASQKIDVGFVRLPVSRDFETLPVIKDRLMLVSGPSTNGKRVGVADCRDKPFVLVSAMRSPTPVQSRPKALR